MSNKHYDEMSIVRRLNKKSDIMVNANTKHITVNVNTSSVGNGSWGKIDFLVNHCGYVVSRVKNIAGKKSRIHTDEDGVAFVGKRNKINLTNMVRNSIKGKK